jgi:hypothetical protein
MLRHLTRLLSAKLVNVLDTLQKAFEIVRDVCAFAVNLKGRRRRQLVATEVFTCHECLRELVKRGAIILNEIEHLTRANDERSALELVVRPRLEYRFRNQSFTLQRLSGSLLKLSHTPQAAGSRVFRTHWRNSKDENQRINDTCVLS